MSQTSFTEEFMTSFGLDYDSLDLSMLKSHPNYKQFENYDETFWNVSNQDKYVDTFSETRKAIVKELTDIFNDFKESLNKLNKTKIKFSTQFNNVDECKLLFYLLIANNFRNSINFGDIINPHKLIITFFEQYEVKRDVLGYCKPKSEFEESTSLQSMNNDYELLKELSDDMLKKAKSMIDEVKIIEELVSQINSCYIFPKGFITEFIRADYGFLA